MFRNLRNKLPPVEASLTGSPVFEMFPCPPQSAPPVVSTLLCFSAPSPRGLRGPDTEKCGVSKGRSFILRFTESLFLKLSTCGIEAT